MALAVLIVVVVLAGLAKSRWVGAGSTGRFGRKPLMNSNRAHLLLQERYQQEKVRVNLARRACWSGCCSRLPRANPSMACGNRGHPK